MNRRDMLTACAAGSLAMPQLLNRVLAGDQDAPAVGKNAAKMHLGLVTYNWGKSWSLAEVIKNCAATGFAGVELRSTHAHKVEINLIAAERERVKQQFADSPVSLVGLGSACEYHSADPAEVKRNIEETKAFIKLCHDCGGEGVKVRPNGLPKGVPVEKTLQQIGESLNTVGRFAEDHGVELRLEVHGRGTSSVPYIKRIMDVADNKAVKVCWNCNKSDMDGEGLAANFALVQNRLGTIHIHDLRNNAYPWKELFALLHEANFNGWTLLEDGPIPKDIPAAMRENTKLWKQLAQPADARRSR